MLIYDKQWMHRLPVRHVPFVNSLYCYECKQSWDSLLHLLNLIPFRSFYLEI